MTATYIIEIHRDAVDRIHCNCSKQIGDMSGLGSPCANKAEVLDSIRHMATQWLRYDSILNRNVPEPSADTVKLIVEPRDLISATEVFTTIADAVNKAKGVKTLKDFFG